MSFPTKFKVGGGANDAPSGVNIEHTSFGYNANQKPYVKPSINPTSATTKTKPRGGWDDDDDEQDARINKNTGPYRGNQTNNANSGSNAGQGSLNAASNKSDTSVGSGGPVTRKVNTVDFELMQCDETFVSLHEFENKTINDLIQPGGARVKPAENTLNDFCKAAESFQVAVISSLLLSKLFEDIPFISKMRTLYLVEVVVKRVKKYFDCIKHNLHILKDIDYSNDGTNAAALSKLTEDIIKYIEEPNKPAKQPITIPANISSPGVKKPTSSLANDTDLLGFGSAEPAPQQDQQKPGKVDPFGFLPQKQSSAPVTSNTTSSTSGFDLMDFGSGNLPTAQQQSPPQQNFPFGQAQTQNQQQTQAPKKFNPFEVTAPSQNITQTNQTQPQGQPQAGGKTGGLNFNKFKGGATPTDNASQGGNFGSNAGGANLLDNQTTQQKSTASKFDQLDNLLESFTGLDFNAGPSNTGNTGNTPSNTGNFGGNTPNTNQWGQNTQTQSPGFNNQGFNQNQQTSNQNQQGGFGNVGGFQNQQNQFGNQTQGSGLNSNQQSQGGSQGQQQWGNTQQSQNQGQFNQQQNQGGFQGNQQWGNNQQGVQSQGNWQNNQNQQMNKNLQQGGFGGQQQQFNQNQNQNQGFGYGQQQYNNQQQWGQNQGQFGGQQGNPGNQQGFQGGYQQGQSQGQGQWGNQFNQGR